MQALSNLSGVKGARSTIGAMTRLPDLPPRVLTWASQQLQADIQRARRLEGSTSSTLHRLELQGGSAVVLRQFDNPSWLNNEPDLALHEARSLERAAQGTVPTPRLLAFDETGAACGVPAVLMTCLPGTVELNPPDLDGWLHELAVTLARLHRISPEGFGWTYFTYRDVNRVQVPAWSSVPELWARALELVQGMHPAFIPRFIHRDFHPANVLWQGHEISGVVDWVNACVGPAGIDVGHCAVNLAQMYGVQAADTFRAAYEAQTGERQDVYWDALSLLDINGGPPSVYPGWPAFGLMGLTEELIAARLDAYVVSLPTR